MTAETKIQEAADVLIKASESRLTCQPVRSMIGELDLATAYQVQQIIAKDRLAKGEIRIGSKIGLTSKAIQEQLGVDQPDYGQLYDKMLIPDQGSISIDQLMQPKAEAEIAFVLSKDILESPSNKEELTSAIDHVCASIEIVGSRIADWNIRITDTIADNASASHFVLSNEKVAFNKLDRLNCTMQMTKNGTVVSEGKGSACLGDPLEAVLWLAKKMVEMNEPLKKGDIVLSGALGPMVNIGLGDKLVANIEGLGTVSFSVSEQ